MFTLVATAHAAPVQTEQERKISGPPAALAVEAAETAIKTCKAAGANVNVVVLDENGDVKVAIAADGALVRTRAVAQRKALTVLTYKTDGPALVDRITADKTLADEINAQPDKFFARPRGGLLIKHHDAIIGAIGVSGAITPPGGISGTQDDLCARAGIDKIIGRLK